MADPAVSSGKTADTPLWKRHPRGHAHTAGMTTAHVPCSRFPMPDAVNLADLLDIQRTASAGSFLLDLSPSIWHSYGCSPSSSGRFAENVTTPALPT
jgi:hypothetical protein